MKLGYVKGDLFNAPQGEYLAHCISADFALGAGIAVKFDDEYDMRHKLQSFFLVTRANVGKALLVDNVFNLVTKSRCYEKPTYDALRLALEDTRYNMKVLLAKRLSMPKIGCGLDCLEWATVEEIIKEVFNDTDIEITIYEL